MKNSKELLMHESIQQVNKFELSDNKELYVDVFLNVYKCFHLTPFLGNGGKQSCVANMVNKKSLIKIK